MSLLLTASPLTASGHTPTAQRPPAAGDPFTVVLDAGHGGKDPGTIGSVRTHREKDIAFNITMEAGRMLQRNHPEIRVVYTRSTDTFVELGRRAEIANKAKADLFVSIHVNSMPKGGSRRVCGVQSYTLSLKTAETNLEVEKRENSVIALEGEAAKKYNYNMSAESNIMFELMQDHDMKESVAFAKLAQNEMVHTARRHDMGVRQANLAVLRLTYMPSVLLEVGFMSTPAEEQYLTTSAGQRALASSIYNAIVRYAAQRQGTQASPQALAAAEAADETPADETAAPGNETAASDDETAATADDKPASASKPATRARQQAAAPRTVYRIQILAGAVKLKPGDRQFKGLKCDMHHSKGRYTYTYGKAYTLSEAKRLRKSILSKFPEAFIATFTE